MSDIGSTVSSPHRLVWQEAIVVETIVETPRVKTFRMKPESWGRFDAGQHVDVRLTAPDGYQAQRSYSIASAPNDAGTFDLTVEILENGEVSPFFHEVVEVGDAIEVRGPIGGHFVWRPEDAGPLLLIGGGSGIVPLMSILRQRNRIAPEVPVALIYSARQLPDVIWRQELLAMQVQERNAGILITLTREAKPLDGFARGRIDATLLRKALDTLPAPPKVTYVCGSTPFVGTAAALALEAGLPFSSIRTERYGG